MSIVVFHNPACGTSRNTLALIEAAGEKPVVIEYLKTGWTKPMLQALFAAANLSARAAMRTKSDLAAELGLTAPDVSEDAILEAMVAHPVLVERPIVCTPKGVRLCRPAEAVKALL